LVQYRVVNIAAKVAALLYRRNFLSIAIGSADTFKISSATSSADIFWPFCSGDIFSDIFFIKGLFPTEFSMPICFLL
jgi:hypothetical protein